jgi:hypothetical protein
LPACTAGDGLIELYVDAGAAAAGADGSWKKPFTTITEALELAANQFACGVRVHVANGTYRESLNISRHTFIVGEKYVFIQGSFSLFGPHTLHLDRLRLRSQPDSIGAAVFAAHPCAHVVLENISISGHPGYGIRQSGGSLDVRSSRVMDTTALPDHLSQGSGIYLTCGVQARLSDVWLDHNASFGLQIAGEGTEVEATQLTVSRTGIHPSYISEECTVACTIYPGTGAIYVTDGGFLEATRLLVEGNLNAGVHVDRGSEALLEHATIRLTERVADNWRHWSNVVTMTGGHIRLHNFVVESSFIGLNIFGASGVDASSGLVTGNYIGVLVPPGGYDLRRISNHVRWVDNRINISGNTDPVFSCVPFPCE